MNRKLIKQGGGGFTIYLPKKWIDHKGLKAGDPVDVKEAGTLLTIDAPSQEKKEVTIELDQNNRKELKNMLTHIYRQGADTIIINNTDQDIMNQLKGYATLLLGFEITETGKQCRLENISEPTQEKHEILVRRIFLIIKETHQLIADDFKEGLFKSAKAIEDLREQQDKYVLFCRRVLTKQKIETTHPELEWELLTFLMHIEHAYAYLYGYAAKNKVKKDEKINSLLKSLGEYFQLFYDAYYQKDISKVHEINKLKSEYQFGRCYEYLSGAKGKEAVIFSLIRELFRLIQIGTSPILSAYFEKAPY